MNDHIKKVFTCISLLLPLLTIGQQNFVSNPSFETYSQCPGLLGDLEYTTWRTPQNHVESTDYFNACNSGFVDVPTNTFGHTYAHSGDAYVGIYLFSNVSNVSYREYLSDTLTAPLIAGVAYIVSFYYRVPQKMQLATDDLGFYLSSTLPTMTNSPNYNYLGVTPSSQNPTGNYLTNNSNWQEYIDTIYANGGEEFITIGSFNEFPTTTLFNISAQYYSAYVFIDDVNIVKGKGIVAPSVLCEGDSTTLYSLSGEFMYWYDTAHPTQFLVYSDSLQYTANESTMLFGTIGQDTHYKAISVIPASNSFLAPDTAQICFGDSATISANIIADSVIWTNGANGVMPVIGDSGNFIATAYRYGCPTIDTTFIAYIDSGYVNLPDTVWICEGESFYISTELDSGFSHSWSNGDTTRYTLVNTATQLTVQIESPSGCVYHDTIRVLNHPPAMVNLGNDIDVCQQAIELNAGQASQYAWNTGSNNQIINVNSSGLYIVTVTDSNGCKASDSIVFNNNPLPIIDLGTEIETCDSALITINEFVNYNWSTGATTNHINISTSGVYAVTVTDSNQCQNSDTVTVVINTAAKVDLGPNLEICDSTTIKAQNFKNYHWSNGDTIDSISISNSGTYVVTISDSNQCKSSDSIDVTIFQSPSIKLGSDITECDFAQLDVGEFEKIVWSSGDTTQSINIFKTGQFVVRVEDSNHCHNSDSIYVTIVNPPDIELGTDTSICFDESVELMVNDSFENILWSTGETGSKITIGEDIDTVTKDTIIVSASYTNVCKVSDTIIVFHKDCNYVEGEFLVYPNPTTDRIILNTGNSTLAAFALFNSAGQMIMNRSDLFTNQLEISLQNIAAGIYILEARTPTATHIVKILKY